MAVESLEERNEAAAPMALPAPEEHKALPSPGGGKSSMGKKLVLALVLLLAVGGAVWKIRSNTQAVAGAAQKSAAAADRPVPVMVAVVQQKTMPIYLSALGTATAYYSVSIKSRVDGQLMSVNVREGQAVRKGQLLLEIDPRPYQATLAQAEGQLTKDQAAANNAQAESSRYTALYQAGVVSRESEQSQQASAGQSAGTLDSDRAAIQAAKVNLAYTRVTSPIDGVVGLRQVDPGNIVHASDANGLLLVTQLQPISVIFTLPEDQLPQVLKLVRAGTKLPVEAYDRSETTHLASGTLLTVDNQIDPTTGTDKVKAVFNNTDGALFPNQFVNVRLILEQRQNATVIPAAALQAGSQGSFVYVMKEGTPPGGGSAGTGGSAGGKGAGKGGAAGGVNGRVGGVPGAGGAGKSNYYVEAQPVTVDVTEGAQVILASGVNPGDQIVIDGQEKLKNGSKVVPARGDGRGAGAAGASNGPRQNPGPGAAGAAAGPQGAGPQRALPQGAGAQGAGARELGDTAGPAGGNPQGAGARHKKGGPQGQQP